MEENDEVLNTANHGEWTPEYESLIKDIKKKRAEMKRKRDNPFGHAILPIAMKVSARTLGMDLVSVQPMPTPNMSFIYSDFIYEDPKAKYKKRKRVIDKLLGIEESKDDETVNFSLGEISHPDTTNFTIEVKENDPSLEAHKVLLKWLPIIERSKNLNGSSGLGI